MSAPDWTTCRVVRDRSGEMWGRGDLIDGKARWFRFLDGEHYLTPALGRFHGPLDPVLDAAGLPVVRTVGDLTSRHIGRRVRVDGWFEGVLRELSASDQPDEVDLAALGDGEFRYGCIPLDTACELLP